ncbi:putative lipopolysaccharide heptosyltransferase III [Geobacter sp. AOG2]|uniref:putative lipopolysaccharide heptosyltransferase III n=1 Tax=Geobacter sp. AOG2 TaxID=1566347 RepID=UPI001CC6E95E|nr:putative lipopolysaccharide heptosyltransferase III [Geobacter sp. AOG2]
MKSLPESILIVNIRLIGDVILTTPLIGLFKEAYPGVAIDFLVNRGTGEFLEKDPRVRRVLYSDSRGTSAGRKKNSYLIDIFRRYDMAVNMNASDRGNIAVLLAGRRWRAGLYLGDRFWQDIWKKMLFTHPIDYPYPIHVARVCQVVAEKFGLSVDKLEAKVFWDKHDEEKVGALLRHQQVVQPYFVIHPFARWRYKYWDFEKFAMVSDAIAERYYMQPLWTSSPDPAEKSALEQAAALCRTPPALVCGELTLNQMTYLISRAFLYVGLDTAISHLAASTGIPMVALYGPTIADVWSPWNNSGPLAQQCPLPRGKQRTGNIIVIQGDRPCIPCGRSGCDDQGGESPCLLEIGTDEVLASVAELLGPSQGEGR